MTYATQLPGLYLLETNKGRAVYTTEVIPKGSIIELCPVIKLNPKDTALIHQTALHDFYFLWDELEKTSAIALGYGSLYNHSADPNALFELILNEQEIRFIALHDISSNSEITINYLAKEIKEYKLWFTPQ